MTEIKKLRCEKCGIQFETNEPERYALSEANGQIVPGQGCPNKMCSSQKIVEMEE